VGGCLISSQAEGPAPGSYVVVMLMYVRTGTLMK
jgi:hypothetical protein